MPNAPAQTYRAMIEQAAAIIGVETRMRVIPVILLQLAGMFNRQTHELIEMRFQADRPYLVNTGKFSSRFRGDATSLEEGLKATAAFSRSKVR